MRWCDVAMPARLSRVAALLAMLPAALALAGWWAGVPAATTLGAPGPPMTPNTAVALLALSTSLWFSTGTPACRVCRFAGGAAAALAVAMGSVTLAEYVSGWDPGLDRLLLPAGARTTGLAGRPSVNASAALILVGIGLLMGRARRRAIRRAGEALAWLAAFTALVGLTGYVYGAPPLYGIPGHLPRTGMALGTSLALLLLGIATALVAPDSPVRVLLTGEGLGAATARRLAATAIGIPVVGLLAQLGVRAGLFEPAVGIAITAVAAAAIGGLAIFVLGRRLDTVDLARARAVGELRAAAEELRTLFEQASDAVFVADLDGRYTEVNAAACRLLARPPAEIVGRRITDFIPAADVPRLSASREGLLSGGVEVSDWQLLRSDGRFVDAEVSAKILPDGRWVALVRDVSEQRAAQQALADAHARERGLRRRLEAVGQASFAITTAAAELRERGLAHVLNVVCLQARALTGAEFVALGVGTDPAAPFDPWVSVGMAGSFGDAAGRAPRPVGVLGKVAREGRALRLRDVSADAEYRGVPGGHPRIGSFMGVPIRFRDKNVGNLYVANKHGAAEFSESDQRAVEALAAHAGSAIETASLYGREVTERAWLQAVIDQMPEGVVLADGDGTIVHCNQAVRGLGCAVEHEGAVRLDLRFSDGRPMPHGEIPLVRAVAGGELTSRLELAAPGTGGTPVPLVVSAGPVHDARGHRLGAAMILQDVSTFKELERLREEWASIVAHDLGQPLAAAIFSLHVLRRAAQLSAREHEALERARRALDRMGAMIRDLLDLSRLEARRMRIDARPIDLAKVVREVVDGAGGQEVGIVLELVGDPPIAWADPTRVAQVLGNLLSNARKHGTAGTPVAVVIEARPDEIEVRVSNHGPGIPPDEMPRLFSRFGRGQRTHAEGTPGLGLGLYIARGLVEAQGGRIWADSVPGETTTLHFTLPISRGRASGAA
jgi:PAS domain S-box-containing protein